jgi:aldehyde:ferredoxin oxidoreductase
MSAHRLTVGNTRKPIGRVLMEGENPVDFSGKTAKFELWNEAGTAVVEPTSDNVTTHPTFNFTIDVGQKWIYAIAHPAKEADQVVLSTSGAMGSGVTVATRYFVVNKTPNTFQLSKTPGGDFIELQSQGTGTHSAYVVGSVQYDFQAADVADPGTFSAWFSVLESGETSHFPPNDIGIEVIIADIPGD